MLIVFNIFHLVRDLQQYIFALKQDKTTNIIVNLFDTLIAPEILKSSAEIITEMFARDPI